MWDTVLNGSHYVRALTGMLMMEDLIHKLEWQAFWTHKDKAAYPVPEQMKRVSKGPGSHYVVVETRNAGTVAEFELLFNEIGSITTLLILQTTNKPMDHRERMSSSAFVERHSSSLMRQMPPAQFSTLGGAINAVINSVSSICEGPEYIHLVLDSHVEMKEGERLLHGDEATCIAIIDTSRDTPIPQQLNKFLESEENKRNLQLLEADAKVMAHVKWAARIKQCQRVVVMSNDTDNFAFLLHFIPYFQTLGMKKIWQQYGTGEKRQMLLLHQDISRLGTRLTKTMIKTHIFDRQQLNE
ncbi:hypothetical protein DPMN_052756 [Dreissena polymorpha]|uniref:Uncharacterized protein n=1 Tax=Dreissena polymorpha TaxID=45954 RepID=A0A9D4HQ53_DREPO|nr:hypothetical protein DPMN_052756 [Dreissena polymorpha]